MKRSLLCILVLLCGMYLVLTMVPMGGVTSEPEPQDYQSFEDDYTGDYSVSDVVV